MMYGAKGKKSISVNTGSWCEGIPTAAGSAFLAGRRLLSKMEEAASSRPKGADPTEAGTAGVAGEALGPVKAWCSSIGECRGGEEGVGG